MKNTPKKVGKSAAPSRLPKSKKIHPAANLFPLMEGEEFENLKDSIKQNGFDRNFPIWLYEDQVLDGRNRLLACEQSEVEPYFKEWKGSDPTSFVVRSNLHRRHLTESQRAMIGAKLTGMGRGKPSVNAPIGAFSAEVAAKSVKVGRRTLQKAKVVLDEGIPELVAAVNRGDVALNWAEKIAAMPRDKQMELAKKGFPKPKLPKAPKAPKPEPEAAPEPPRQGPVPQKSPGVPPLTSRGRPTIGTPPAPAGRPPSASSSAPGLPYPMAADYKERCRLMEQAIKDRLVAKPTSAILQGQLLVIEVFKGKIKVTDAFPNYLTP